MSSEQADIYHMICIDRCGYHYSQRGARTKSAVHACAEYNIVLSKLMIPKPFMIVAHSYGGDIARQYHRMYPNHVAGILFIDSSTEYTTTIYKPATYITKVNQLATEHNIKYKLYGVTPEQYEYISYIESMNPLHEQYEAEELNATEQLHHKLRDTNELIQHTQPLKDIPITVLTSENNYCSCYTHVTQYLTSDEIKQYGDIAQSIDKQLIQRQIDLSYLSSNSRHITVSGSGHQIQMNEPQLVADEVNLLLQRIKSSDTKIPYM